MGVTVEPNDGGFGAAIRGVDLRRPPDDADVAAIRAAWLAHQVVWFPDQPMAHADLERFTRCFGDWGHDPYVAPVAGHPHVLEIRREPDEPVAPFGGAWHSDWSFQAEPPSATLLHAKIVPPVGGETWFADGAAAYEALSERERAEIAVIEEFLPKQMSEEETRAAIAAIKTDLDAQGMKDMGRVMGELKSRHGATLDMSRASGLVKEALS